MSIAYTFRSPPKRKAVTVSRETVTRQGIQTGKFAGLNCGHHQAPAQQAGGEKDAREALPWWLRND